MDTDADVVGAIAIAGKSVSTSGSTFMGDCWLRVMESRGAG